MTNRKSRKNRHFPQIWAGRMIRASAEVPGTRIVTWSMVLSLTDQFLSGVSTSQQNTTKPEFFINSIFSPFVLLWTPMWGNSESVDHTVCPLECHQLLTAQAPSVLHLPDHCSSSLYTSKLACKTKPDEQNLGRKCLKSDAGVSKHRTFDYCHVRFVFPSRPTQLCWCLGFKTLDLCIAAKSDCAWPWYWFCSCWRNNHGWRNNHEAAVTSQKGALTWASVAA